MADLITFRALPTDSLPALNPFLFLNHHGPQVYPPNNGGLPFGPHPHKGFETLISCLKARSRTAIRQVKPSSLAPAASNG